MCLASIFTAMLMALWPVDGDAPCWGGSTSSDADGPFRLLQTLALIRVINDCALYAARVRAGEMDPDLQPLVRGINWMDPDNAQHLRGRLVRLAVSCCMFPSMRALSAAQVADCLCDPSLGMEPAAAPAVMDRCMEAYMAHWMRHNKRADGTHDNDALQEALQAHPSWPSAR